MSTACVACVAIILTLALASIAAEPAISTVILVVESSVAVTSKVYTVEETATKLEAVPPATLRSPITNPVTASLKVAV